MSIFGLSSPGMAVIEQDFSDVTPGASSTTGGFSGAFQWGPVLDPQLITGERNLVDVFGTPKPGYNRKDFFSVAFFLRYSNACYVTRVVSENALNAVAFADPLETTVGKEVFVPNRQYFETQFTNTTGVDFVAKYPGSIANGVEINILDALTFGASDYAPLFDYAPEGTEIHVVIAKDGEVLETYDFLNSMSGTVKSDGSNAYYVDVLNEMSKYIWIVGEPGACSTILRGGSLGAEYATYSDIARSLFPGQGNGIRVVFVDQNNYAGLEANIQNELTASPGANEVAYVITEDGFVREVVEDLSKDPADAMYYVDVINEDSAYIDMLRPIDFAIASETDFVLTGATSDTHPGDVVQEGYSLLEDTEAYDVSLVFQGAASNTIGNYIISLAEQTKMFTAYTSPQFDSVKIGGSQAVQNVIQDRQAMYSSSYGFMDSNWGLIYDIYNKSDVWIPMNAISAGLQAQVETGRGGPWYVGYGPNWGRIANVKRLAWEQKLAYRNELYKAQVNPLSTFRNDGILLYGSKTLQTKPSAFDRLNVRRLFIHMEKSIMATMKYYIGELNTGTTRLRVLNSTTPFMRDLQSRSAVYRFIVICDESNNGAQVTGNNGLQLDVAAAPSKTIDFIGLRFTSVGDNVDFEEIFN